MNHRAWIFVSGVVWAFAGALLLYKGLGFLELSRDEAGTKWLMGAALLVGLLKGRFVLSKTAKRLVDRIASLPAPISARSVYPKSYWILLGSMVAMGMALKFAPTVWRGAIDVAIGAALLNGAMYYFKAGRSFVVGRT